MAEECGRMGAREELVPEAVDHEEHHGAPREHRLEAGERRIGRPRLGAERLEDRTHQIDEGAAAIVG